MPAESLDGLPERRRETLLWKMTSVHGYEEVDEFVRAATAAPCQVPEYFQRGARTAVAMEGDDGRYHLRLDGVLHCGEEQLRGGELVADHEQECLWRHNEDGYRSGTTWHSSFEGTHGRDIARWPVRTGARRIPPGQVPPRERCQVQVGFGHWPPHDNPQSKHGRIRRKLTDAFGPWCGVCGHSYGVLIDHDHFSGLVRGMLCRFCNSNVDTCPHVQGCPRADYLNKPPALPLGLLHPDRRLDRRRDQWKIDYYGLDPYDA